MMELPFEGHLLRTQNRPLSVLARPPSRLLAAIREAKPDPDRDFGADSIR